MGGCQNYDPVLGTLNIRCRMIIRIQKGTIILTATRIELERSNKGKAYRCKKKSILSKPKPWRLLGIRV